MKARVGLFSELPDDDVRRAHLEPIRDIAAVVDREIARRGPDASIAVLPEGPMTIPVPWRKGARQRRTLKLRPTLRHSCSADFRHA